MRTVRFRQPSPTRGAGGARDPQSPGASLADDSGGMPVRRRGRKFLTYCPPSPHPLRWLAAASRSPCPAADLCTVQIADHRQKDRNATRHAEAQPAPAAFRNAAADLAARLAPPRLQSRTCFPRPRAGALESRQLIWQERDQAHKEIQGHRSGA